MQERAESYARAFPQWPGSHPVVYAHGTSGRQTLQGVWSFGQDYRNKSVFYGAYPGNYLERLAALFPEHAIRPGAHPLGTLVLHAFAGSLPGGAYDRCDIVTETEYQCDIRELPDRISVPYDLVVADPPYSDEDAEKYKAPPLNRLALTSALARVTRPGGYLCWLDTVWPMHRKTEWRTAGWIAVLRSTNHRVRLLSIFERQKESA